MTFPFRIYLHKALLAAIYMCIGAAFAFIAAFALYLDSRADLDVWHMADLDQEFTVDSGISSFEEYLALEERLFRQLDELVYGEVAAAQGVSINRYSRGSLSDPQRWSTNWNRSFELPAGSPRAAVLLLHGMSDSPYSLRQMGERLHAAGASVLGLRMPGHGTAPSGLVELTWQDMDAAMRLAIQHLSKRSPDVPLFIVGYSTGAALAVNYALAALVDPTLPRVERLVILSPAIGVTPAAALAVWQARLGHLLGLDKLAWSDILPEYDPFKYGSFAVNAGDVVYRLTREIQRRLTVARERDLLGAFPPVLAFSSVVDATVSPTALVEGLFAQLPANGHELVLFDINRRSGIEPILKWDPSTMLRVLQDQRNQGYRLSLVTQADGQSTRVVQRTWQPGGTPAGDQDLALEWPEGVYSLAHIALPFAPEDPLYGGRPEGSEQGFRLGDLALRGERGVLHVAASDMLRQRWNPFYQHVERRMLQFLMSQAQ
ncbi:MAG: alpha/beta hydrolase [Chromatiaceae bacterium]|nr:alpha/beta hydrolase [Gammaproteobacteria bacterium]MCP5319004.1 alpha/beta hydrolase [Chromatiaceae bacterium]MCW5587942.1 alpha/beta hydrolase [Chromatiales bacterium]MCP5436338.1 alpha/beta hydrolase [Chromatiaceae bacterium]HOP18016.1 alpha/beta hydrolase [Gammaproteobacteria bacterium]